MALTLSLTGGGLSGPGTTKTLSSGTLSIGRGAGNDWVLPDPDRHLSKTHCVLSVEHNRYFLTDLSTNGVHINGARQATARDSRTELTDGDDFRLGDYTITATEVADARSGRGGSTLDPFATGPAEGGDPLDIDPLEDPLGHRPDPSFRHPIATPQLGRRAEDPFDVDEERKHRKIDPDDDLFSGVKPSVTWQGPSQADNADAARHSFTAARVIHPVDPGTIDFDALIGDIPGIGPAAPPPPAAPQRPRAARPPPAAPAARSGISDPFADMDGLLEEAPPPTVIPEVTAPPPVAAAVAAPVAAPVAAVRAEPPRAAPVEPADPFAEADRPPAAPPRPAPTPAAAPPAAAAAPPVAPPGAAPSGDARAVLLAFLEGAGVPTLPMESADPAETMRAVGQVFRAMTEGLREVLMSRAAIKSDLRVEATMIQARNNNALKFSVTVDEAVAALLNPNRPGYMKPLAATKEAFNDLKSHEIAVMSGVQTSLMGLLKRFEPATLEGRMAQGLLGAVLPAARKARYWDSFQQVYGEIAKEAEDDFQAVFGRAFARAYTAQSRKGEPAEE